jgi:hypothetical protein
VSSRKREEDDDDDGELDTSDDPSESDMDDSDEPELVQCPHCAKYVSEEAERCHHCGQYVEDASRAPKWVIVTGLIILAAIGFGILLVLVR